VGWGGVGWGGVGWGGVGWGGVGWGGVGWGGVGVGGRNLEWVVAQGVECRRAGRQRANDRKWTRARVPSRKRPLPTAMQERILEVVVSTRAMTPHRIMPGGGAGAGGSARGGALGWLRGAAAAGSSRQQQAAAGSSRQQQAAAGSSRQQQAAAGSSRQQQAAAGPVPSRLRVHAPPMLWPRKCACGALVSCSTNRSSAGTSCVRRRGGACAAGRAISRALRTAWGRGRRSPPSGLRRGAPAGTHRPRGCPLAPTFSTCVSMVHQLPRPASSEGLSLWPLPAARRRCNGAGWRSVELQAPSRPTLQRLLPRPAARSAAAPRPLCLPRPGAPLRPGPSPRSSTVHTSQPRSAR
jgi:hypothetical protein